MFVIIPRLFFLKKPTLSGVITINIQFICRIFPTVQQFACCAVEKSTNVTTRISSFEFVAVIARCNSRVQKCTNQTLFLLTNARLHKRAHAIR